MVFLFQYTWWESYNWFHYKLLLSLTETVIIIFAFIIILTVCRSYALLHYCGPRD